MRRIPYFLVDVFTQSPFGGNQLAVIPKGDLVREEEMTQIAREFNLSETTFIYSPGNEYHNARVRIFTPGQELPFAGHPTLGTAFVIARYIDYKPEDKILTVFLEEKVGTIRVDIDIQNGAPEMLVMTQPLPTFGNHLTDIALLAELLSLKESDFLPNYSPQTVSCGVPYLITPLKSLDAVRKIKFRSDVWEKVVEKYNPGWIYPFAMGGDDIESHVHGRMFAPEAGIVEDAATGSANGPLGCYLVQHKLRNTGKKTKIISEQGYEMGRPSKLYLEIERSETAITQVKVGGYCVFMGQGQLFLP
ncbi:MAG: PhzF family phenazine biosynthesis protein [Imperialibacter sp.]|uniref:PhzF family phenazine biosynthesis protein n=1 Tax=Imperialibacter sp. TaxID=2038411 RepID=UPI0032F0675D